jgi:apolipoprotein N-acyltransferase
VLIALSFVLPGVWGEAQIADGTTQTMRVALLQVNLDPERVTDRTYASEMMEVVEEMIFEAAEQRPGLVILPESGLPGFLGRRRQYESLLMRLSETTGIPIVTGAVRHEREDQTDRFFNSALLFKPSSPVEHYDKLHPVPFSERLPYDDVIPWIQRLQMGQGFYSPGRRFQVFDLDGASFSVLICFESIFPRLASRFTKSGADFLVNITNDSWFGDSPGPYQHAEMAVLRAVENRVSVARCANTGVSMFIDPYGRVHSRTAMFTRELVIDDMQLLTSTATPYRRWGEWFSGISLASSLLLLGGTCVALKKRT